MEYIIYLFFTFLIVNLAVGLYYGQGVKTLKGYAVGEGGKMNTWLLAATIAATWATGSGLSYYLGESFKEGVYKIGEPIVASITLVIMGFFALRMGEFYGCSSVAQVMRRLYGKQVAFVTAVTAFMCCLGFLAGQLLIFSNVAATILGVDSTAMLLTLGTLVILYSVWGGIHAVVFTDLLQFAIMGLGLPGVIYLLYSYLGSQVSAISFLPEGKSFEFITFLKGPKGPFHQLTEYGSLLLIGFMPPLLQRCLVNRDPLQTRKAFRRGGLGYAYIIILVMLLGRMMAVDTEGLDSKVLLTSAVEKYPYLGFQTLISFVLMAMALSSADSYINTSSVLLCYLSQKKSLSAARLFGVLTGVLSVGVVLFLQGGGVSHLIFIAGSVYSPIVVPVLMLALLGFRSSQRIALMAMMGGALVALGSKMMDQTLFFVMFWGAVTNFSLMLGLHHLLGEPGGWVGIKDKAPLMAHSQLSRRHYVGRQEAIRNFDLNRYLRSNLPKKEGHYLLFGLYVITFVFGSIFFLPRGVMENSAFVWQLGSFLLVNSIMMTYPFWPEEAKHQQIISPIWAFGVGYILFYIGALLLLLGGFHMVHVVLWGVNLTLGMLLLRRKLMVLWVSLGGLMAFLTYRVMGYSLFLAKEGTTPMQIFFALSVTISGLLAIYSNKRKNRRLERRHLTLGSLQRSTEDALAALRLAPDHFAKQLVETNHAGVVSAYEMSKERLGETDELTKKIAFSAQYLAKTLQLIQTQTQLQTRPCILWKFLNRFYESHPDLDEAGLILYNRTKNKKIKWDIDKMHQLLYKTYYYLKRHHPEVQYSYLHVEDTVLNYPGHQRSLPAVAFSFTFGTKRPGIASCYTHLERAEDPYLMGNRHLREMQTLSDKHYGHLDLTKMPQRALIVLPVRLDKIRPKAIEDQPAPDKALRGEFLREAKFIEGNFWTTVTQQPHYDIPEIEQVVHFMKATHQHQTRKDNTPYYAHPLIVAKYVSEYDPRPHMLIAALLHDIVEDTHVTLEEVVIRFGSQVAELVKLLSNIDLNTFKKYKMTNKTTHVAQLAQNRDAILIKACDRIHNLETLTVMPRAKQREKAKETLEHYVPIVRAAGFADLAHRLEEMAKRFL